MAQRYYNRPNQFFRKPSYINAQDRQKINYYNQRKNTEKFMKKKKYERKDQKTVRNGFRKISRPVGKIPAELSVIDRRSTLVGPAKLKADITNLTSSAYQTFEQYKERIAPKLTTMAQNKWVKRGIKGAIGIVATNLVLGGIQRLFKPKPAIPSEYERGYDIINEYMTDFGSPLKLSKAAHKTMRPYRSSTRSSFVTSTNSVINNNIALTASKNAIRHTEY